MSSDKNRSVDPRVRLAIAQWPDDAPRGAVTTFCAEHSISRKTFYVLRRRARLEGPAAVLEPRSRRPRSSPARLPEAVRSQALEVRAALERSGLDHGPISVHDKMASMGLKAPSPAWLARLFRDQGVARSEPSKRPRAAWRRFVYPAPKRLLASLSSCLCVVWVIGGVDSVGIGQGQLLEGLLPVGGYSALDQSAGGRALAGPSFLLLLLPLSGSLVLDVADSQPQQLDRCLVGGEVTPVPGDLAQLVVQRLDCVGGGGTSHEVGER